MSIGHKSTIFASKVMATTVLDLLTKPDLLKKIKKDWEERMDGFTYKSPLPPDLKPPCASSRSSMSNSLPSFF